MKRLNRTLLNRQQICWIVVILANLILPLPMGLSCTAGSGITGIFAAIGLLWFFGHVESGKAPRMGFALNAGGLIVAMSQLYPGLQIISGILGLSIGERIGLVSRDMKISSAMGGLLVTLLTGGMLIAIAWMAGLVVRGVTEVVRSPDPAKRCEEGVDF